MKKKSAVIIALAVILISVSVIAFSIGMRSKQEPKPDGSIAASDKAGGDSQQPSGDNEGDSVKVPAEGSTQPSESSTQQSEGTEENDVKKPDGSSQQGGGTAGSEDSVIAPEDAKKIIAETADLVIRAIADKDFDTVSEYTHPDLGVRFTPYTFVTVDSDLVFNKNAVKNFMNDGNVYHWGFYDGSGEEIRLTPQEYYEKFIYPADYVNAPQVGYNEVLSFGNMLENQFEVYKGAIVVEYYYPGFNPQYEGLDWRSLRLVFLQYNGSWKLTGLINNQWTI